MGMILSDEQCAEIKSIRKEIEALNLEGWYCEANDTDTLNIFNVDKDIVVFADLDGSISMLDKAKLKKDFPNDLEKISKFAALNGQIRKKVMEFEKESEIER